MITIKNDPKHKINTQSELFNIFEKKEEIKLQKEEIRVKYNKLHKEYLGDLCDEYNKLSNYLSQIEEITYFYKDKPMHHAGFSSEDIYSVYEINGDHKRNAIYYGDYFFVTELVGQCIYYDNGIEILNFNEDFDLFNKHADDWVVFGTLPDLNGGIV